MLQTEESRGTRWRNACGYGAIPSSSRWKPNQAFLKTLLAERTDRLAQELSVMRPLTLRRLPRPSSRATVSTTLTSSSTRSFASRRRFRRYLYREALFPTLSFQRCYGALCEHSRRVCILHLAATTMMESRTDRPPPRSRRITSCPI